MNIDTRSPSLWYDPCYDRMRILYPSGLVELFSDENEQWMESAFTYGNARESVEAMCHEKLEFLGCI